MQAKPTQSALVALLVSVGEPVAVILSRFAKCGASTLVLVITSVLKNGVQPAPTAAFRTHPLCVGV